MINEIIGQALASNYLMTPKQIPVAVLHPTVGSKEFRKSDKKLIFGHDHQENNRGSSCDQ